ncbi:hypothetical protein Paes_0869 [Prosthecochloris aestuarii DSM 271]|uniref:Uncharacterized protein n=1 Tax=Prosthecochloris aestuarii (strain DSM 271 / SK 413) TaxID=290512 RepID=B4S777_PROA2|nr:hypothetical protein Paes_0869 [Prosthecochloris aestuarii DSM 271]
MIELDLTDFIPAIAFEGIRIGNLDATTAVEKIALCVVNKSVTYAHCHCHWHDLLQSLLADESFVSWFLVLK